MSWVELFSKAECRDLFARLEKEVVYFTGDLATVKVFGKTHNLPRKQSGKLQFHFFAQKVKY